MPRNPSLPVLKCDFCPLSTRNQFIFKRHRKRCLRDNGSPSHMLSLQSLDTQGVLLEGEVLKKENGIAERTGTHFRVLEEGSCSQEQRKLREESGFHPETRITLRLRKRSVSDPDSPLEHAGRKTCFEISRQDSSVGDLEMETDVKETEGSLINSSSHGGLPPPNVCRNYRCEQCSFFTNKSREFLRHKKQQHKAKLEIFTCSECEYASQYKHKLMRHMSHLHNLHLNSGQVFPENPASVAAEQNSDTQSKQLLPPLLRKMGKPKKVVSSKAAPRSSQNLDSLLVKLRSKQKEKVMEANLSSFFINSGSSQSVEEGCEGGGGGGTEGDLYKCKLCLFTANSKSKTLRHLQACHINASLFRCNLCTYKSYSKIEFYAHKKKHTSWNTVMFKCTECAYATEFRPNFDRHMQQHGCYKPNKCSLCSYATDHEGALKRHVTSHHPNTEENQSLVIAGDEGPSAAKEGPGMEDGEEEDDSGGVLEEEGLEGDGFRCPLCSSLYKRCADLNRHMKLKHNVRRKEFVEQNADDDDEEVFDIDDDDIRDEEIGYDDIDETSGAEDSEDSQPLSSLKNAAGKKTGKKCSYCSYIPKWPGDLKRHMKVHSVVKRFKCSLCWKKYKYLGDLSVHMRRDHEVDPDDEPQLTPQKVSIVATRKSSPRLFRCPACTFYTKVKVEMDRHSQEHTEEKTYSCKLCSYQTYWRGDMGRHLYRRHPAEVTCEADVKEFFVFRPERRALSKGGRGVESEPQEHLPDGDDGSSKAGDDMEGAIVLTTPPKMKAEVKEEPEATKNNDQIISEVISETISNCSVMVDQTGNKMYHCQLCSFTHLQSYKMKTHMDTHLNLKQFKCPVCGRRGNWKYDMRKHISSKHPNCKQEVMTLSIEEAKATIGEYLASMSGSKKDSAGAVQTPINIRSARSLPSPHKPSTPNSEEKPASHKSSSFLDLEETESTSDWPEDKSFILDSKSEKTSDLPAEKSPLPESKSEKTMTDASSQKSSSPLPADVRKKRTYEYKCSHCQYRSWYRSSVTKHQQDSHAGQEGLGILARPIYVVPGEQPEEASVEGQDSPPHGIAKGEETKDDHAGPMEMEEEEEVTDSSLPLYRCAECGKEGTSKGSIKKHYNYIHPNNEVRIVSVADGVEFDYYTGLSIPAEQATTPPLVAAADPSSTSSSGGEQASLTSILNDPKKHGYSRPFKCSVCGQRSNWKWDIKKHLQAKHPGQYGYVVVLQIDQAQATCPSRNNSSVSLDEEDSEGSNLSAVATTPEKRAPTPAERKPASSPSTTYKYQEMLMGRYKRYKCSGCGYRSNWRTDIIRHIERRHREGGAEVIFMGVEEARETFESYSYQPANVPLDGGGFKSPKPPSHHKAVKRQPLVTGKVWHCPKCKFMTAVRTHVVTHMQGHGMKPFRCLECGLMSRFRSPMNRHIRKLHNTTDYKMYCKIIIKYASPAQQNMVTERAGSAGKFVEAYLCRLCTSNTAETPTREEMIVHLMTEHGSTDASQALKIKKKVVENGVDAYGNAPDEGSKGAGKPKRYFCTICPYGTAKRSMLTFHHSYHQPSSQNRYKCKLCPYYVCAPRLLHQHMKTHEEGYDSAIDSFSWKTPKEKTPPSSPTKNGKAFETSPKRHICEKCPYTTNSKNDFLYHKQFHRPKSTAPYKCDHCDYWVTHRRLLRQHARLHGVELQEDWTLSPSKSQHLEGSTPMDSVEAAAQKQRMISCKITASLSTYPAVSPMKMAMQYSNRPGYVFREGVYKKLHQCSKCPYTNVRSRNVRLHELMHGWRRSEHPLMKCPHCDYYVGAKGLLSHHLKVHNQRYQLDPTDSTIFDLERREQAPGMASISAEADDDSSFVSPDIPQRQKVDTLLEILQYKKYSCEKCPYASGKRSHFKRHMELHGSRQRHMCLYCDYSVPSFNLLQQHQRIHLMPNHNLLVTHTVSNLKHLQEVPADVALASALPPTDSSKSVTISVVHDHLELYENDDSNSFDNQPKKLYRCDRCPYANVRRDHLLTHLRFHLSRSQFQCPYCDYSAPKQQLLTQHIRVHFCPLPELSEWLIENGQTERAQEVNDIDLTQALEVAEKFQTSRKRKLHSLLLTQGKATGEAEDSGSQAAKKLKLDAKGKDSADKGTDTITEASGSATTEPQPSTSSAADTLEKAAAEDKTGDHSGNVYICQYCDREFPTSKLLVAHELQHLIGNHFEITDDLCPDSITAHKGTTTAPVEAEENHQHVAATASAREEEVIVIDSEDCDDDKIEDSQGVSGKRKWRSEADEKDNEAAMEDSPGVAVFF